MDNLPQQLQPGDRALISAYLDGRMTINTVAELVQYNKTIIRIMRDNMSDTEFARYSMLVLEAQAAYELKIDKHYNEFRPR